MKEKLIILTQGIQGSGKSTWAKNWVLEDPEKRVRISCDDIRRMFGKYWVPSREPLVSNMNFNFIVESMKLNYDIVVDEMNLNKEVLQTIELLVTKHNNQYNDNYKIEYKKFFDATLSECLERDSKREGDSKIGEEVIKNTFNKYKDLYDLKS